MKAKKNTHILICLPKELIGYYPFEWQEPPRHDYSMSQNQILYHTVVKLPRLHQHQENKINDEAQVGY